MKGTAASSGRRQAQHEHGHGREAGGDADRGHSFGQILVQAPQADVGDLNAAAAAAAVGALLAGLQDFNMSQQFGGGTQGLTAAGIAALAWAFNTYISGCPPPRKLRSACCIDPEFAGYLLSCLEDLARDLLPTVWLVVNGNQLSAAGKDRDLLISGSPQTPSS